MPKQHDPIARGSHTANQNDTGAPSYDGLRVDPKVTPAEPAYLSPRSVSRCSGRNLKISTASGPSFRASCSDALKSSNVTPRHQTCLIYRVS